MFHAIYRFLIRFRHRMEVVLHPDRFVPEVLDHPRSGQNRRPLLIDRHTNKVVAPALWGECSETHTGNIAPPHAVRFGRGSSIAGLSRQDQPRLASWTDAPPSAEQLPVAPRTHRMRLHSSGQFVVALPAVRAIDLFTPEGERAWVPGWDPRYPAGRSGEDPGTVFVTDSDGIETTWVVMEIDRQKATAAYVRITPGQHAGIVRVACADTANGNCTATVTYDMTLLGDDASALDAYAERSFERMLQEWSSAIAAVHGTPPT